MRNRIPAALTATALVGGLAIALSPPAAAAPTAAPAEPTTVVTLITGDRVGLTKADATGTRRPVLMPDTRRRGGFRGFTVGEHVYVIPLDALPLVASGQLDRQLFDVAALADAGYDDRRGDLPLIQTGPSTRAAGVRTVRELPLSGARALAADKSALAGSWRALTAAGGKVWLDSKVAPSLDRSAAQIGAPAAWQAGVTGAGVTVAVVDTGVDQTHPDLASREIAQHNFTDEPTDADVVGHGTHVASTIAGTGAKYRGIAHGAKILDAKALGIAGGQLSWIIAAVEWSVANGADIVNMSLGADDTPGIDPLEEAVNRLSAETGTLFVVAAGNSGRPKTVGTPGTADAALTVGSVERDDSLSPFSSRGPRIGDAAVKPDVTAPGSGIAAAKSADGLLGDPVEPGYVAMSGTSMASPHVAGAAALLAQKHPDWTGAQIKAALTASAKPTAGLSGYQQGAGRVDVAKALAQNVTTSPTTVSFGAQLWPHNDDKPVSTELTYKNSASTPVNLDLAVDALGPDGKPAPSGLLTVSPAKVTVPAGGSAKVTVTGDTRLGSLDGHYSGSVVATGGGQNSRTPIGVDREVESYDVTLKFLGPNGKPSADWLSTALGVDSEGFEFIIPEADGTAKTRLPKGRHILDNVYTAPAGTEFRHLAYPAFEVTGATEVVLDARKTKPVRVTAPTTVAPLFGFTGYEARFGDRWAGAVLGVDDLNTLWTGQIGPDLPADVFTWTANQFYWDGPGTDFHALAWFQEKSVPTGFTRVVTRRDLATLRTTVGVGRAGGTAGRTLGATSLTGRAGLVFVGRVADHEITDYVNAENVQWEGGVDVGSPEGLDSYYIAEPLRPRAGQTYRLRANYGIFGPGLPRASSPWASRDNDTLRVNVGLWSDGPGNWGLSLTDSARTTLYRNGKKIGESSAAGSGQFPVPTAAADYRLETEGTRPADFQVSTKVSATWTFRSDPRQSALPLSAVRFDAKLRPDNSAAPGRFTIPVTLQLEDGRHTKPRTLSVDVSYDEGKTWRSTHIRDGAIHLDHPRTATSVSLRAKAEDGRGGTVKQTIIRAYLIKK
ncbi:subtilisin family serine protease [Actinokineospora baliensis]|uniref:S8 family serine peptidase n=1 Tax=Actinokineospora baliensis TaxID=547056 RepID=UPI00195B44AB|nr:S8 family serine peptidase [Actinokineospora baliensis]MBM7776260.1 subtilisin family serine protease [Actinokineospora baliensis]